MRRPFRETVCFVGQRFPEVVVDRAYFQHVSVAVTSAFVAAVSQRITILARVSCFTVADMSLIHRFFVILGLRFRASALFPHREHKWGPVSSYVHFSPLGTVTLWGTIQGSAMRYFITLRVKTGRQWFAIILKGLCCIDRLPRLKSGNVLFSIVVSLSYLKLWQ